MLLPCKSNTKQTFENVMVVPPTPPIFHPSYLLSLMSDFYFKSRFVILSLSSTILDSASPPQIFCPLPPRSYKIFLDKWGWGESEVMSSAMIHYDIQDIGLDKSW